MDKTPPNTTDKLRVLCLHGYRQTGNSFKSKIGSFRKFLNKYVEFEFVTAPHIAPPLPGADIDNDDADGKGDNDKSVSDEQRSWWFNKDDGSFKGTNKSGPAIGFEESLRLVEKEWETNGPYQGLLGFSQGASLVGLICHLSSQGKTPIKPHFAVMSSGFRSQSLVHINFYDSPTDIPSLHIFGETDEIIPREMSELLASTFKNKQILTHPGGHYFPATAKQKPFYLNYFQDQLQEYLEVKEIENASADNLIQLEDADEDDDDDIENDGVGKTTE